jgi:hypothetical protein
MGVDLFDLPSVPTGSGPGPSGRVYSIWRYYDKDRKLLYVTQNPNQQVIYTSEWWPEVDIVKVTHYPNKLQQMNAKIVAVDTESPKNNVHGRT